MKTIFPLLLSIVMLVACSNNTNQSTQTTTDHSSVENEKLIRRYFDTFNKHQWKELAEFYTESAEFKDPSFGIEPIQQNRAQIIEKYSAMGEMFPDIKDEIKSIYPSGDQCIIVEFVSTGTAPDSSAFTLPICTIFTIEKGKITKDYTYYDNSGSEPVE